MVAEQLAAKLNTRLNYVPSDERGTDGEEARGEQAEEAPVKFTKYEEELEINDFPQHTRWKVTSKVREREGGREREREIYCLIYLVLSYILSDRTPLQLDQV